LRDKVAQLCCVSDMGLSRLLHTLYETAVKFASGTAWALSIISDSAALVTAASLVLDGRMKDMFISRRDVAFTGVPVSSRSNAH